MDKTIRLPHAPAKSVHNLGYADVRQGAMADRQLFLLAIDRRPETGPAAMPHWSAETSLSGIGPFGHLELEEQTGRTWERKIGD
jgi:hypothetical protein